MPQRNAFPEPAFAVHQVRFDVPYSFDYTSYISDIDNTLPELTLTVEDTDHVSVNGFVVTYNYPEEMLGEEVFVTLSVSDGDLTGSKLIKVKITSNYPPEIDRFWWLKLVILYV